ncbi:SoxR reducing system RseC family protein [Spirochaeta africana]|uniref:Positive regulator of sigma E activity n=1 Tax=Spirochaeta africana (strain ATCC 700263 / DSM 8902 / Z-7692) TaxID=889378 RepID=H9UGI8_SPIAZ|nr:SoxR reducing system RseC family protein [Spirochaeta africana]AFG36631.1 Positive regulator of sigma E activity [Spirochaeta africana DSM 8902]
MMYQVDGVAGTALFSHTGVVTAVADGMVEVEIHRPEGCGACSLKSACSQGNRKVLTAVPVYPCKPGDSVTVEITNQQGWQALFFGIVLPFLCTISGVLATVHLTGNEALGALVGLGSAAGYYGVFYLFRSAAARRFTITARPV